MGWGEWSYAASGSALTSTNSPARGSGAGRALATSYFPAGSSRSGSSARRSSQPVAQLADGGGGRSAGRRGFGPRSGNRRVRDQLGVKPGEREKRVGRAEITFHVTPKGHAKVRQKKLKQRDKQRAQLHRGRG